MTITTYSFSNSDYLSIGITAEGGIGAQRRWLQRPGPSAGAGAHSMPVSVNQFSRVGNNLGKQNLPFTNGNTRGGEDGTEGTGLPLFPAGFRTCVDSPLPKGEVRLDRVRFVLVVWLQETDQRTSL